MNPAAGAGANPAAQAGIRMKLGAGHPGARRYQQLFGDALVCVRHRIHPQTAQHYTTVEIVVAERQALIPLPATAVDLDEIVAVGIYTKESALRQRVIQAGACWDIGRKAWLLPLRAAQHLGLQCRVKRIPCGPRIEQGS